jgi:hypothetical protein
LRAILIWSRLHGLVSPEIAGNIASMGIDPGQVFEAQLATLTAQACAHTSHAQVLAATL